MIGRALNGGWPTFWRNRDRALSTGSSVPMKMSIKYGPNYKNTKDLEQYQTDWELFIDNAPRSGETIAI
jgi:hypothetical protein